jgi:ketosteroid isomerase-like protein
MDQSSELKQAMLGFYQALSDGDAPAIERLISREAGVLNIGTDPEEWWAGHDTVAGVFKTQMEEMGGGFPIEAGDPQAYAKGDVGWVADRPKLKLPDGEVPFRITTVFQKEGGEWRIVLNHASFGVKNEEALGQELTI